MKANIFFFLKENSLIKDKKEIEVPQDTLFEIPRILTPDLSNKDKEEKIQVFTRIFKRILIFLFKI